MWTTAEHYVDPGLDYYEQKYHEHLLSTLRKKAQSLGFDLVAQSPTTSSLSTDTSDSAQDTAIACLY